MHLFGIMSAKNKDAGQRLRIAPGSAPLTSWRTAMRHDSTIQLSLFPAQRLCAGPDCGKPLVRRAGEKQGQFLKRKYCTRSCSRKGVMAAKAAARPARYCLGCGKQLERRHNEPHFARRFYCGRSCRPQYQFKQVDCTCEQCGVSFSVPQSVAYTQSRSGGRKYCSRKCKVEASKGKRGGRWAKIECLCGTCGKTILRNRSQIRTANYCSNSCLSISTVRKQALGKRQTWIETALYSTLDKLDIPYEPQAYVGRFAVDALLAGGIVVECLGDFWHCNPDVYRDGPACQIQRDVVAKDHRRNLWFAAHGYRVVHLWEADIKREGVEMLLERNGIGRIQ